MKRLPLIVLATVVCTVLIGMLTSNLTANVETASSVSAYSESTVNYPIGLRCVVTVDPESVQKERFAGGANIITGFIAPDTVRGILVSVDDEWVILQDGKYDNWIPRDKVILLSVCR